MRSSAAERTDKGFWGNMRDYTVSLLKAWWGDAATEDNDFCFDYLPRLTGNHGTYDTVMAQIAGTARATSCSGENPAVGSANGTAAAARDVEARLAGRARLLADRVARPAGRTARRSSRGEMRTEDIATEVFFFPAAAHTEKDGTFTNTQRMLQWHHKAVEPAGDARSDLWFAYHLGQPDPRRSCAGSARTTTDRPLLDLTWDYPTEGEHRRAAAPRRCWPRSTARTPTASRCPPTRS